MCYCWVSHVLALNTAAHMIGAVVVNRRRLKVIVSQQGKRRGLLLHLLSRHILEQDHLVLLMLHDWHQTVLLVAFQCCIAHNRRFQLNPVCFEGCWRLHTSHSDGVRGDA